MRDLNHITKYESMNAEQLKVELLKLELQKMEFSLEKEKELYLREKKSNEPESTEDLIRRLKRNREKRKRKALLDLKNKTSETKNDQHIESPL